MNHELKIWPQFYEAVKNGTKTFEVRDNDRGFQNGDYVALLKWSPEDNSYRDTPSLVFKIGYVLPIDADRVVFSLLKDDRHET